MFNDWRYKVVERPTPDAVQTIKNNVKGMSSQEGGFPAETKLHGRLGGGLYAYIYPLPIRQLEILTEKEYHVEVEYGTLLKHKPKNESIVNLGVAVDISTRVSGDIICKLNTGNGEELINWIRENYESFPPLAY
ncbi:hypothetical protein GJ631_01560 [Natronomonas sp. CBA1123]|uniref:hypothetical protein n=1 Tax=Natronomonas sp. CBA1123 TaxID=2668070 RepID=UPI0012EA9741|nr:hypothetical protein [Natronomonas sp. CBA1123]MUV85304.1 hypothetical protein [Natronomonas sp. CBA1123]